MPARTSRAADAFRRMRGRRQRALPVQIGLFFGLLAVGYFFRDSIGSTAPTDVAGLDATDTEGAPALRGPERRLLQDFPKEILLDHPDPGEVAKSTNKGTPPHVPASQLIALTRAPVRATPAEVLILHSIGVIYMFIGLAIGASGPRSIHLARAAARHRVLKRHCWLFWPSRLPSRWWRAPHGSAGSPLVSAHVGHCQLGALRGHCLGEPASSVPLRAPL